MYMYNMFNVQPQIFSLYNTQKAQFFLMKFRAAVRSVKETEDTSQWQREPKNTIRQ